MIEYLKEEEKKYEERTNPFDVTSSFEKALKSGDLFSLKYIFETKKTSFDYRLDKNRTFLHHAAERGSLSFVRYFIENGINSNIGDQDGITPVHLAAKNSLETIKYLISKDGDANAKTNLQKKTTHFAAESGKLDILKYLIGELKMDPKEANQYGYQPIHYASTNGRLEIVKVINFIDQQLH